MGWQPIETAPKDGTHILAAWVPRIMPRFVRETIMWRDGGWVATWNHDPANIPENACWQSLPDPPAL